MTKIIRQMNSFKRDIKRITKRNKDLAKLYQVVSQLANGIKLNPKHRPHKLSGNWYPKMECHIDPDWLLIYEEDQTTLTLYRSGSHADLF
jgi:mRNA interferase YafQ